MRKIVCLLWVLLVAFPCHGAPARAPAAETAAKAPAAEAPVEEKAEPEAPKPNEYVCKYYTVDLPEDWSAITPPTEQLGNVNAIFANNSASAVVTMVVGPSWNTDARTVATMFAEQFKATKAPVERNGRFTFNFPYQNGTAQAIVGVQGKEFMVVAMYGRSQECRDFLRQCVKSAQFNQLLQ